jgi:transposase
VKRKRALIQHIEEGMTIKEAATQLGINYSTAKHIVKLYRSSKNARIGSAFIGSLGVILP